jgi:hypothetical protein
MCFCEKKLIFTSYHDHFNNMNPRLYVHDFTKLNRDVNNNPYDR